MKIDRKTTLKDVAREANVSLSTASHAINGTAPLNLELELLYLNTSSIKSVLDIFDLLEAAHAKGRGVSVTWFYDMRNERVGELAEEFKEDCTFPFSVVGRQ